MLLSSEPSSEGIYPQAARKCERKTISLHWKKNGHRAPLKVISMALLYTILNFWLLPILLKADEMTCVNAFFSPFLRIEFLWFDAQIHQFFLFRFLGNFEFFTLFVRPSPMNLLLQTLRYFSNVGIRLQTIPFQEYYSNIFHSSRNQANLFSLSAALTPLIILVNMLKRKKWRYYYCVRHVLTQHKSCHMSMLEFIKWIWKNRLYHHQFTLMMLWLRLTLYEYASSAHLNYINCLWIQYLFVVVRPTIERTFHERRAQRT